MISKIIADELTGKVKREIDRADNIVIVSHFGPDGDSLGSSLGLHHFLKTLHKKSTVLVPTPPPNFLMWMPGARDIIVYVLEEEAAKEALNSADLIFALDFNTPKRVEMMADALTASPARKILVDHHLDPDHEFVDLVISHPEISSTSEIIFRLICAMGYFGHIDLNAAVSIYTGMMTDTGGFTFNSNKEEIYSIIYELLKIGVDKDEIYRKVYNNFSENRMRLQGYCIHKKMKIYPEYQAALITLTHEEMIEFDYQNGDAEGFVNIPLSIDGVVFSVFMREDPDKIKVSLRSEGSFPANRFAAEIFNGGGHLNASGGESYTTLEEAVQKFEAGLPLFTEFLEQ